MNFLSKQSKRFITKDYPEMNGKYFVTRRNWQKQDTYLLFCKAGISQAVSLAVIAYYCSEHLGTTQLNKLNASVGTQYVPTSHRMPILTRNENRQQRLF